MKNKQAFTLIELLVVVLIIGILAAVAVPQYKIAVAKSRVSGLLPMLKSVAQAEETYYLANGQYADDWDTLSLEPGRKHNIYANIMTFPGGYIGLNSQVGTYAVSTLVPGVLIYAFYEHSSIASLRRKMSCYAKMGNDFANQVCQSVTHKKNPNNNNGPDTDNIYHF